MRAASSSSPIPKNYRFFWPLCASQNSRSALPSSTLVLLTLASRLSTTAPINSLSLTRSLQSASPAKKNFSFQSSLFRSRFEVERWEIQSQVQPSILPNGVDSFRYRYSFVWIGTPFTSASRSLGDFFSSFIIRRSKSCWPSSITFRFSLAAKFFSPSLGLNPLKQTTFFFYTVGLDSGETASSGLDRLASGFCSPTMGALGASKSNKLSARAALSSSLYFFIISVPMTRTIYEVFLKELLFQKRALLDRLGCEGPGPAQASSSSMTVASTSWPGVFQMVCPRDAARTAGRGRCSPTIRVESRRGSASKVLYTPPQLSTRRVLSRQSWEETSKVALQRGEGQNWLAEDSKELTRRVAPISPLTSRVEPMSSTWFDSSFSVSWSHSAVPASAEFTTFAILRSSAAESPLQMHFLPPTQNSRQGRISYYLPFSSQIREAGGSELSFCSQGSPGLVSRIVTSRLAWIQMTALQPEVCS